MRARPRTDRVRGALAGVLLCLGVLGAPEARGQDDLDDILGGFDSEEPDFEVDREDIEEEEERFWDLSGSVEVSGSVNYIDHRSDTGADYHGLSRLRNRLNLKLDLELPFEWDASFEGHGFYDPAYLINGRDDYTSDVLSDNELFFDTGDAWIRGELTDWLDIKLGRQVVAWGRSEALRVLDILNPLDQREPARADIEDLRRTVAMARVDAHWEEWTLSAIAIPELRFDLIPEVGSDFYPGTMEFPQERPRHFEDTEYAGSLTGIFSGWDISFHGAWLWNDTPRFERRQVPGFPARLVHDRFWLVGAGGNYTVGSFLFKGEVAYLHGIGFFNAGRKSRVDGLFGIEYYGLTDTTFVVEILDRFLFNYESQIGRAPDGVRRHSPALSLRLRRNFWNDTLHVQGVGIILGLDTREGSIVRVDIDYDVADALVVGVGLLLYQQGVSAPLNIYGDNDRLIFRAKWSF